MTKGIVVADAGPLIAFGKINKFSLLVDTLGKLIATQSVIQECTHHSFLPGAKEIVEAMNAGLITEKKDPHHDIYKDLIPVLGKGESTSIMLAVQLNAGLLIDEKLGRQVADKMNLKMIGTAGVLLLAKKKKLIKNIKPLLLELKNAGYYFSEELIKNILKKAEE